MAANSTLTPEKEYSRANLNICRVCGDTKDYPKSTSIFSKVGKEKRLIAENIEKVLNIVIEESEILRLPCNVCRRCQDLLIKFDKFKTLANETQEMIKANSFVKRGAKSPNPEPSKRAQFNGKDFIQSNLNTIYQPQVVPFLRTQTTNKIHPNLYHQPKN